MPSDPHHEREDSVLEACLESVLAEGESALDRLCRAHPDHADLLRRRVATLRSLGLLTAPPHPTPASDAQIPERLADYRIHHLLGRGGMGAVYVAERAPLGRRIALKVIRAEQLYFPGARQRFQREVEAIARLQVPGVVPILDVGEIDGVPFYAMELLDGIDLADVVHRLRDRGGAKLESTSNDFAAVLDTTSPDEPSGEDSLFEGGHARVAARIAMRLARVLGRVHEHDIIHRDVKPSNVVIDRYGRVTLVDFGLAHLTDAVELTQSGAVLGSLPYMAPEQVRGERAEVGPATDVYSVGVTLHELLHLTPAFEASDVFELRERICAGRRPLRSGPRDLETIIACATDPNPARRYPTADALADDLLRFLERRPVRARRSGITLRAYRWAQRHPARATAALLLASFSIIVPTAIAVRTSAALSEAERQRNNYERTLNGALDLLYGAMMPVLLHEAVRAEGALDPVRRDALEAAAKFYESLRPHDPDNSGIRRAVLTAKARECEILELLGELERARTATAEALALTEGDPQATRIRFELRMTRGTVFERLGDMDAASAEWLGAFDELERLDNPSPSDRTRVGRALHAKASVLMSRFDPKALDAARDAARWFERLASDQPESVSAVCYAAMAQRTLAAVLGQQSDDESRFGVLLDAKAKLERRLELHPDNDSLQSGLASTLHALGEQYRYARRDDDAIPHLAAAARLRRELVATYPERDVAASNLATTLVDLGSALCRTDRATAANEVLGEALEFIEGVRKSGAESARLDASFAKLHSWRALVLEKLDGPSDETFASHEIAIATFTKLLEREPGRERERRYALAVTRMNAISAYARAGRRDGTLEAIQQAMRDLEFVMDLTPNDPLPRRQFGELCIFAATVALRSGAAIDTVTDHLRRGIDERSITTAQLEQYRESIPAERLTELLDLLGQDN